MWQRRAYGPSLPLAHATATLPQRLLMVASCLLPGYFLKRLGKAIGVALPRGQVSDDNVTCLTLAMIISADWQLQLRSLA